MMTLQNASAYRPLIVPFLGGGVGEDLKVGERKEVEVSYNWPLMQGQLGVVCLCRTLNDYLSLPLEMITAQIYSIHNEYISPLVGVR